ncbi:MAG TPA: SRPBCC family protein [Phnomibacter sp.]|nr:SRPBCC family protein [Phnomibacter sp.]
MEQVLPDCEIVDSRIFKAPIDIVFSAWTNPDHLVNWWGPAGFTNTFFEFDFRVGGRWRFMMHGPDKGHYPNEVEFTQIEAPTLLAWKRISKPLFTVHAQFEKLNEHETRIVFRQIFDTAEECQKIRKYTEGKNDENFDRLEIELQKMIV